VKELTLSSLPVRKAFEVRDELDPRPFDKGLPVVSSHFFSPCEEQNRLARLPPSAMSHFVDGPESFLFQGPAWRARRPRVKCFFGRRSPVPGKTPFLNEAGYFAFNFLFPGEFSLFLSGPGGCHAQRGSSLPYFPPVLLLSLFPTTLFLLCQPCYSSQKLFSRVDRVSPSSSSLFLPLIFVKTFRFDFPILLVKEPFHGPFSSLSPGHPLLRGSRPVAESSFETLVTRLGLQQVRIVFFQPSPLG